jgi:Carboxypeptidase regulatory-like domain
VRKRTIAIALLAVSFLLPARLTACTYFPPNYKVGSRFTVHVASADGLTFAGVRVILVSGNRVAKTAYTNPQGVAQFENVQADDYSLEIDQLGELGLDTATISVVDGVNGGDVKLRWPSLHILRATELKGTLLDAAMATPMADTDAVLVNAIDGSLVARDLTRKTGEFDLGIPAAGFYFMKLQDLHSPDRKLDPVPVLVGKGQNRELTLAVQATSCGMQYSELCSTQAETVSHLAGRLADASGAVIDRARIELLRPEDKRTLATVAPDKSGHFDFQYMADDEYQLRISAVGFAPVLVPITLASDSKAKGSIDLRLNVIGGSCNDANVASSVSDNSVK